jgi:hypothetical protein
MQRWWAGGYDGRAIALAALELAGELDLPGINV